MMLSNPPLGWGIWTLTARAIDDSGLIRTSAPVYLRLPVPSTTVFLTSGPWRYLNDGSDPGPNWRAAGFDDATWPSDYTVLGTWPFADTEIDIGPSGARHPTLYFRSLFSVNPIVLPHINRFILGLYRESGDGVVVYLNGLEILRTNLADGPVSSTNYTGLEERDAVWSEVELDGDLLLAQNILAVEMHQNSPNSEQFAFDLELSGHLDATTPLLSVTRSEAGIQLSWERKWYWSESGRTWFVHHGSLEQATEFDGPWSLVEGFPAGAYSASTAAGVPQLFFRLRWP